MLDNHFWFDLNQGKSINASDGSSYHIQHVVRNPKKFGFEDESHMQKHASYPIEDIKSGYKDIDHNLEHHVMSKGFIRGYHNIPSETWGLNGQISFDAANDEHAAHALNHMLPLVKAAEEKGKRYDIDISVGHRGKNPKYISFSSSDQIEQHIGKIAPKSLQLKEPKTFQGVGQVGEPLRRKIKAALKAKDSSAPNWKLEREVGYSTGTWGDSVEYKTYKQLFKELLDEQKAMSASAQLRRAGSKTAQGAIKRAGGDNVIQGTVASKAGLSASQLGAVQKKVGKGGKVSASQAQQIVGKLFGNK